MKIWQNLQAFTSHPAFYVATGCSLGIIVIMKLYFRGGICRVDADLDGKIAVITGGNTGIGKETVEQLVKRKCRVIMGARDVNKSEDVLKYLQRKYKNAQITFHPLDLASKDSISGFAAAVLHDTDRIDFLINNAAVMALPQRKVTMEGFQMQMGVNHFGHFFLTYLLWDAIKKSAAPRIVTVSSTAHQRVGIFNQVSIDFNDINFLRRYTGWDAYGRSKAANILFTKQLQRKMDQNGIPGISLCLHPGVVRTQLMRYLSLPEQIAITFLTPLRWIVMKSAWEGAQTTLYTVLEREDKLVKGGYYADCKLRASSSFTSQPENAKELWRITQEQLGIKFVL